MPRNADGSPNTFIASPSDGCACVSGCTPDGEYFALFTFAFESGGCAVFEARVHVKHGLQRITRRGPSATVGQEDISFAVHWRKERLARDDIRYLQVGEIDGKYDNIHPYSVLQHLLADFANRRQTSD